MIIVAPAAIILAFFIVGPSIGLAAFGAVLFIICAIGLACDASVYRRSTNQPTKERENQP